jgi:hypothetical protein
VGEIADMMLDGTMDSETGEWNFDGEDGPGWPMTGAEAAEYRRAERKFPAERKVKPLFGLWLRLAEGIDDAGGSMPNSKELANATQPENYSRNAWRRTVYTGVQEMIKLDFAEYFGGVLCLTDDGYSALYLASPERIPEMMD